MRLKVFLLLFVIIIFALRSAFSGIKTDSLQMVIEGFEDRDQKLELLMTYGDSLIYSEPASARKILMHALDLAKEQADDRTLMETYFLLAKACYFNSDLKLAMEYALKMKEIAADLEDKNAIARASDAIGIIYYDIGDQIKSSEHFFASLKIYEKINNKEGVGACLCRIGTLYFDQQDYDKAEEYYENSIKIAGEIGSQEGIASNLNNLARVYSEKEEYGKALSTYQQALDINIKEGNAYLVASNHLNIAEVYFKMKDYNAARSEIEMAQSGFSRLGSKVKLAKSNILLSKIDLESGNAGQSELIAKEALRIGTEQGYREISCDAMDLLYRIYLNKNDSAEALRYFILEKQQKDSLFVDEKEKTLTRLELQYHFEKNEQNLIIARQKRNIIIIIISSCLLFSLVIIYLILKQLRFRAKKMELDREMHRHEIEFKNKEMALNVMTLMKKNEMLSELSKKLLVMANEAPTAEGRDTIKLVVKEVQKSQENEIWKEFSTRFKEIHGEFYEKLLKKYPGLTPNELKLCAFLRLNMSSKDIAELTGQRVSSLETARYRLRQKLGIANSDINLVTFLSSI